MLVALIQGNISCNIQIFQDKIKTNKGFLSFEKDTEIEIEPKKDMARGEMVGGFNFGSTIVLMFEAPKSFEFNFKGRIILCSSHFASCYFSEIIHDMNNKVLQFTCHEQNR